MAEFKFALGVMLRDIVTRYKGIVLGRTQYFTGCNHYGLMKRGVDEKGKPGEYEWFDEGRLEQVGNKVLKLNKGATGPSGPMPNAPSAR